MAKAKMSPVRYYERLPVAVYICDRHDLLVNYNSAAETLLPILPETGKIDFYSTIAKYDRTGRLITASHRPVAAAIKANTKDKKQELKFILPDDSERYILVSSEAIWDDMGGYNGSVHIFTDVTELRHSQDQEALLAAIVHSSEDAIIAKNLDSRITSWNPAASRLFGYAAEEAVGQHISLIIPEDILEEEKMIIGQIRKGENVEHFETERINKAGVRLPISLTISPVRNKEGQIIGASTIARDISRQKESEAQLQAHMEHLEDVVAQRTTELKQALSEEKELGMLKSRFVSMASHEFRTPLAAIKLSASLIGKYTDGQNNNHQITKHLQRISGSVSVLSAILTDFLSLEKLESGKVTVALSIFNITELCIETAAEMQLLAKPGQQINYRHKGSVKEVMLDEQLLKNCLNNLLSNAIKYSAENKIIELLTDISNEECRITVRDEGIGIPQADQKHLFNAFFRAGNVGTIEGTGLGLNIVSRYAALMGGAVSFTSEPGTGTVFELRFPTNLG